MILDVLISLMIFIIFAININTGQPYVSARTISWLTKFNSYYLYYNLVSGAIIALSGIVLIPWIAIGKVTVCAQPVDIFLREDAAGDKAKMVLTGTIIASTQNALILLISQPDKSIRMIPFNNIQQSIISSNSKLDISPYCSLIQ